MEEGRGMIRMRKKPAIMGSDVPRESRRRNEEIFSANATCAMTENINADNPNPDTTRPVAVARCVQQKNFHLVCSKDHFFPLDDVPLRLGNSLR